MEANNSQQNQPQTQQVIRRNRPGTTAKVCTAMEILIEKKMLGFIKVKFSIVKFSIELRIA